MQAVRRCWARACATTRPTCWGPSRWWTKRSPRCTAASGRGWPRA